MLRAYEIERLERQCRLLQKRQQSETALLELIYHPRPVEQKARLHELGAKLEIETMNEVAAIRVGSGAIKRGRNKLSFCSSTLLIRRTLPVDRTSKVGAQKTRFLVM